MTQQRVATVEHAHSSKCGRSNQARPSGTAAVLGALGSGLLLLVGCGTKPADGGETRATDAEVATASHPDTPSQSDIEQRWSSPSVKPALVDEWGREPGAESVDDCCAAGLCLCFPSGIAVDSEGFVYVSESTMSRITKFSQAGKAVLQFGANTPAWNLVPDICGSVLCPMELAFDHNDVLFVHEVARQCISSFDTDGNLLNYWKLPGDPNHNYLGPVVGEPGVLYLIYGYEIRRYTTEGTALDTWTDLMPAGVGFSDPSGWPTRLATDSFGNLHVLLFVISVSHGFYPTSPAEHWLLRISPEGERLAEFPLDKLKLGDQVAVDGEVPRGLAVAGNPLDGGLLLTWLPEYCDFFLLSMDFTALAKFGWEEPIRRNDGAPVYSCPLGSYSATIHDSLMFITSYSKGVVRSYSF